jgi:hypothetical protein
LPDGVKEASGGDAIDHAARDAIRLAHRALERFPNLVRKHKVIAGGAAISSSLVVIAGVAIARRMRKGQSGEEAVRTVTEKELEGGPPAAELDEEPAPADPAAGESAPPSGESTTVAGAPRTPAVAVVGHANGNGSAPD